MASPPGPRVYLLLGIESSSESLAATWLTTSPRRISLLAASVPLAPVKPPTIYAPVGCCIYCGSTELPLTDEHIFPDGLGGRDILPAASCKPCATITGKFEGAVMRGAVWALRQRLGMKGGKRKVPSRFAVKGVNERGEAYDSEMLPEDIGLLAALPDFHEPPGFMVGKQPTDRVGADWLLYYDGGKIAEKHAPGSIIDVRPESFARLVAKIAHARSVAALGIYGFAPLLLPLILGRDDQWPYLVGRAPVDPPGPQPGAGHWCQIFHQHEPEEGVLLGRVRLFAELDGPIYDVVVGRLRDETTLDEVDRIVI